METVLIGSNVHLRTNEDSASVQAGEWDGGLRSETDWFELRDLAYRI